MKNLSDELNPDVVTSAKALGPRRKTVPDYFALAIATCGVGYFPIAPGTWGSAVGVGVYLLLRRLTSEASITLEGNSFFHAYTHHSPSFLFVPVLLLVILALSLVGIWAASRAESLFGRKDAGAVVIDEVVGQLMTFAFVFPYFLGPTKIATGFILFRAFDILKPYPVRKLEKLPSGLGIVVDDIAAGLYAGTALAVMLHAIP